MPKRLCSHPTCPNEAHYRGRCPDHARTANREGHANKAIYGTKRWRMLRRKVLHEQPLCANCGDIATDVHHITDISAGGAIYVRSNLEALCHVCHSQITRREQLTRLS